MTQSKRGATNMGVNKIKRMKSIKEEAKAYEEAIERAKSELNSPDKRLIEYIFPELKESEDERIRRTLIDYLKERKSCESYGQYVLRYDHWIAWLEEQGQHKKFRDSIQVGDKVTRNEDGVLVNLSQLNRVAKKQGEQHPKFRIGDTIKKESTGDIVTISEIDLKNREYRLSNTGFIPFKYEHLWELVEQNPAWSEEGVNALNRISTILVDASEVKNWWKQYRLIERDEMIRLTDFLKSLKDRLQPQLKQEWNEEDEIARNDIIAKLAILKSRAVDGGAEKEICEMEIKWLKSLKDRFTWKPSDEQMEALEHFVRSIGESGYVSPYDNNTKLLYSLLSDLKKLRKE